MTPSFLENGVILTEVCTHTCIYNIERESLNTDVQISNDNRTSGPDLVDKKGPNLAFRVPCTHTQI